VSPLAMTICYCYYNLKARTYINTGHAYVFGGSFTDKQKGFILYLNNVDYTTEVNDKFFFSVV